MANYHLEVNVISRGKGQSVTRRANYISGQRLYDSYYNETYYRHRDDVLFCGIFLPEHAPPEFQNLQPLCTEIERAEKRKDARTAREFICSLPNELPKLANIRIVSEYIHANFLSRGLCAVAAIHAGINQTDPARNNPHVHMIVSTRAVNEEGFCPKKDRELDRSENMEIWREQWEQVQNRAYARNGLPIRVSHESLEMQGKHDWEPTIHLSRIDWQREKNGERTANGNKKREIQARNEARQRQFCQMENREIDITR